jgi:signal transduction histidine kinase
MDSEIDLQSRIRKLTLDLQTTEKARDEAERSKNEYMQNVAHQLAAPINAIKMNIEALGNTKVHFERKKVLLRSIYSQGTILAHLIKNFSLMSHLEADHHLNSFREKPEAVDVCRLCVNFANDFQPIGDQKDQRIVVHDEDFDEHHRPQIWVIKNLFSQVIYNLLENAVKYGDHDSTISLSFDCDRSWVSTLVKSTGVPIKPAEKAHIFDRGVRGDSAKRLHPAGTGFGLYIARRIIEIHKGEIALETNGKVSTFIVRCPKERRI